MKKIWNIRGKEGKYGDNIYCDLYKACKDLNNRDLKTGKRQKTLDAIKRRVGPVDNKSTLITTSGDWGIKKTECKITSTPLYSYTIEDATHGGAYLNLEINSVLEGVKRWFMTNQYSFLHEKIYPVPLGICQPDWKNSNVEELRSIKKEGLCYANFTMTSPYRIRVAEWCSQQSFIEWYFPKRYKTQDIELNMPILSGERLEMKAFLKTLASYNFAIAPTGNGLDTFRTWDCILCNTVPIVQDNWMNRVFSRIWPMVLVPRYEFTNVPSLLDKFMDEHGENISYDYSLLLEENFDELLNRLENESHRLRREYL